MSIRVMLVDDHAVVRAGYRRLIDAEVDLQVVADVASGDEACAALRDTAIDVVVMDLSLREGSGLEAIGLDIEPSGISDGFEEAPDNAPQRVFPVREGRPSVHRMRRAHCFVGF